MKPQNSQMTQMGNAESQMSADRTKGLVGATINALLLMAFGIQHCHGQVDTTTVDTDEHLVFINPEISPSFPGGEMEMFCFIDRTINKHLLRSVDTTGTAYAQFAIDTTGHISEIRILKPLTEVVDNELLRVIGLMPNWRPGRIGEKVVDVQYNLPLRVPYKDESNCR